MATEVGKAGPSAPWSTSLLFEFEGEMTLGAADEDGLQQLAEGLVGDLGADAEAGDLLLVLDDAELFHGAA